MKRLNVGCGTDIKKGWINLDVAKLKGVDVVHDVEKIPWPFKKEEFDEIVCQDLLEHVELVPVLKETHRILKKGGRLKIRVPHFTSTHNFEDPTHKRMFASRTFVFFVRKGKMQRDYYFDFGFSKLGSVRITFDKKGILFLNALVESFINISEVIRLYYEFSFLSRIFPAQNVELVLIK